jgi:hypothetical protein
MPTRPVIVIHHWDALYETYESKRLARGCSWVAVPNKHDGRGYRRLLREKDGVALFGAWVLMVEVASKCPVRGVLADLDGPLDSLDLEDKTGGPSKIFDRMVELVTGERIAWARQVTDEGEIAALLTQVTAARTRTARRLPQTPAGSPSSSADFTTSPAGCGQNNHFPQTPADSRRLPQDNAPRGRAQADRTGQDITGPDTTHGSVSASPSALDQTVDLIFRLLGKKRRRLSADAEHALARQPDRLPLTTGEVAILTWFYGLPHDESDVDLRGRFRDSDSLAINLFKALERAEIYSERSDSGPQKKSAAPSADAPPGFWEWFLNAYPNASQTSNWLQLPESVRSEFYLRKGVAA